MKLIRKIAESSRGDLGHRAIFRALGHRNFCAPSDEYFKRNCANKGAVFPIAPQQRHNLYGDVTLGRVNLGRDALHSRILGMMRGSRMQDAFLLQNEFKSMDDLHSSNGNPEELNHTHPLDVYPSFCLRLFIEPCCLGSLIESEPDVAVENDPGVVRADSVKKKRKRKMNKHKLRKLRRLLRRKTH